MSRFEMWGFCGNLHWSLRVALKCRALELSLRGYSRSEAADIEQLCIEIARKAQVITVLCIFYLQLDLHHPSSVLPDVPISAGIVLPDLALGLFSKDHGGPSWLTHSYTTMPAFLARQMLILKVYIHSRDQTHIFNRQTMQPSLEMHSFTDYSVICLHLIIAFCQISCLSPA